MGRPKSVVFTVNGRTVSVSVDGMKLPCVTNVSIERGFVTVVQEFYPETLSVNIEGAELTSQKEGIDDGQS